MARIDVFPAPAAPAASAAAPHIGRPCPFAHIGRLRPFDGLRAGCGAALAAGLAALLAPEAQASGASSAFDAPWRVESSQLPVGPSAVNDKSELRLIPGWVEESGERIAGLSISLSPGWKTYWRMPGDAGIPPEFDWSGSENLASAEVIWPAPAVFDTYGMTTLGYKRAVTLPLRLVAEDPGRPMTVNLKLFYGVCEDICMPQTAELSLTLPPAQGRGDEPAGQNAAAGIRASLQALPRSAEAAGARLSDCRLEGQGREQRLQARLHVPDPPQDPLMAVVEGQAPLWFKPAELSEQQDGSFALLAGIDSGPGLGGAGQGGAGQGAGWLDRGAVRVTLIGADGDAIDFRGCDP